MTLSPRPQRIVEEVSGPKPHGSKIQKSTELILWEWEERGVLASTWEEHSAKKGGAAVTNAGFLQPA